MMNTQDTKGDQRGRVPQEQAELREATRLFFRSLVHTGRNMTLLPVTRVPRESRQHFGAAGREFTRGWAALIRGFADRIDKVAKEASSPGRPGEAGHSTDHGQVYVRARDKD
ncbi:MAG: hypothetical protein C5B60_11490 [Chloroflexi bacterium]|nr:MAG: hypothetical protein C5B60_11490 [Chloroflexota bacterium]